jgi:uncharacterized membrane protein YbhN (UPF0104 family)
VTEQKTTSKLTTRRIITGLIAIFAIVASCWYILRGFQWAEVGKLLGNMNVGCFALGVFALNIPYWHLRALRWRVLLQDCGRRIPYRVLHIATVVGVAIAPFTPAQLGEGLKVELLRRYGDISRETGYATFVVERVVDLGLLLVLGALAVVAHFPMPMNLRVLLWVALLGLAIAVVVLWRMPLPDRFAAFRAEMKAGLQNPSRTACVLGLSLLGWIVVAVGWQIILMSIGVRLSIFDVFGFMASSTVMLVLSFVPAGVGIWEAGGSLLLEMTGVQRAQAQAGALVLRLFGLATLLLAGARWAWWRWRQPRRASILPHD